MTFGFPAAFWFALVVLPVAAAFLYRQFAVERIVPALVLWEQFGSPSSARSFSTSFRRLFSLLVQLLLLAMLILSLADPMAAKPPPPRTILILDISATMQTREGPDSRLDLAQREAHRIIGSLGGECKAALIRGGATPILAQDLTTNMGDIASAIDASAPVDAEGDVYHAVDAARAMLDPKNFSDVVVLSDFAGVDVAALRSRWSGNGRLRLDPIGSKQPDAAVADLQGQWVGSRHRIVATVVSSGMNGRVVPVQLSVDNQLIASHDVTLADGPVQSEFNEPMRDGAVYTVRIDAGDSLAVDDSASGVARPRGVRNICLVTRGNEPLERALAAEGGYRVRVVPPEGFDDQNNANVIITDVPNLRGQVSRDASWLFVGAADPFGWSKLLASNPCVPITQWAADHPAIGDVDPALLHVWKVRTADWAPEVKTKDLIVADNQPVCVEVMSAPTETRSIHPRWIYWLFDLRDTDFAGRVSFPLLLWNTIDYLVDGARDVTPEFQRTGTPLRFMAAADVPPVITDPSLSLVEAVRGGEAWIVSQTFHQGIYRSGDGQAVAVNLLSTRGTLPIASGAAIGGDDVADQAAAAVTLPWWKRMNWSNVLLAALTAAAVEWLLFHRRVVRIA